MPVTRATWPTRSATTAGFKDCSEKGSHKLSKLSRGLVETYLLVAGKVLVEGVADVGHKRGALQLPLQLDAQELRLQLGCNRWRGIAEVDHGEQVAQAAAIRFQAVLFDELQ